LLGKGRGGLELVVEAKKKNMGKGGGGIFLGPGGKNKEQPRREGKRKEKNMEKWGVWGGGFGGPGRGNKGGIAKKGGDNWGHW